MTELNIDIFYLVFKELQNDEETLYSCLSVNKTLCEIIIPILWKDPWKFLKEGKEKLLLNVIISHLSNKQKDDLKDQGIDFLTNSSYQKPLFNYIGFCRYLNFDSINKIVNAIHEKSKISIIKSKVIDLFINENTKFTHLYIPQRFDFQILLSQRCFSNIEFLSCSAKINDIVLTGLTKICKSIKELELVITQSSNNYGIVRLIEASINIDFLTINSDYDESFCKILENSLIKHADTIQHFKITEPLATNVLSSFINLKILELSGKYYTETWDCLKNLSLPFLQVLKARRIPINVLASLIENTNGNLIEIKIDYVSHDEINNKRIIQAIYQNCPYLEYLKLSLRNRNIIEFEKLLVNCKYLNEFLIDRLTSEFDWDNLFKVLTKSSPNRLFKFKFYSFILPSLDSLKLFFDNWEGKHPMLLQFSRMKKLEEYSDLIEEYKEKGIVKEWI
ncbi:hypothetical protein C1645_817206 [Glomus cerebriforme]|uniref:F-box domain-containing protein n=1 Tax=Glomus cerebriforme TaxID=658196 RepID=A0A397TA26_9GLOM|nr:hypothetical protein C1645_817206 [Glomus cerebriforme]